LHCKPGLGAAKRKYFVYCHGYGERSRRRIVVGWLHSERLFAFFFNPPWTPLAAHYAIQRVRFGVSRPAPAILAAIVGINSGSGALIRCLRKQRRRQFEFQFNLVSGQLPSNNYGDLYGRIDNPHFN
jgi:hypothetical protein